MSEDRKQEQLFNPKPPTIPNHSNVNIKNKYTKKITDGLKLPSLNFKG
jgi:hypothetical protein